MDPATVALVVAGALAALGIKRGARRPRPQAEPELEPEYLQTPVRPNRLEGGGLRPAVTEKEGGDDEGIGDLPGLTVVQGQRGLLTAAAAIQSGGRADVRGATSGNVIPLYGRGGAYGYGGTRLGGRTGGGGDAGSGGNIGYGGGRTFRSR